MFATSITQTGVAEWEQGVLSLVRRIEQLVDSTPAPLRIWMYNLMEQLVTATEPGAVIASGTFSREEALMYSALFQATLQFRNTPITVYLDAEGQPVQMTPEAITGYRRMPAPAPLGGVLGAAPGAAFDPPLQFPGGLAAPLSSSLPRSAPAGDARPPEAPEGALHEVRSLL